MRHVFWRGASLAHRFIMAGIKEEKKIDDVIFINETTPMKHQLEKKAMSPKFIRTCMKCGKNCYSSGEYTQHLKEAHGKEFVKSDIAEPRKVQQTLANTGQDVPEHILVKPRKVEPPEQKPAKSRQKRTKAAEPATDTTHEQPAATETAPEKELTPAPEKKTTRRRKTKKAE